MIIISVKRVKTDGRGWYQEEGKPAVEILPGTVINIPANVKHWHEAAKDSWFAHLAFSVPGEKTENVWLEPVTDTEYDKLPGPTPAYRSGRNKGCLPHRRQPFNC